MKLILYLCNTQQSVSVVQWRIPDKAFYNDQRASIHRLLGAFGSPDNMSYSSQSAHPHCTHAQFSLLGPIVSGIQTYTIADALPYSFILALLLEAVSIKTW